MKSFKNIIWGLILIAIGVIWGLNALEITKIDIFFDGWWTLFIIIPCFANLFKDTEKTPSIVGIVIGVLLLLASQNVFSFDMLFKIALPLMLVMIGFSFLFKDFFNKKFNESIKKLDNNSKVCCATFSGQKLNITGEFKGMDLEAIFGGIDCHLEKAKINDDVLIKASAIFGGIDIFVPEGYNVKVESTSIFGGVDNKKMTFDEKNKTIYIKAVCIFGGVDVK